MIAKIKTMAKKELYEDLVGKHEILGTLYSWEKTNN